MTLSLPGVIAGILIALGALLQPQAPIPVQPGTSGFDSSPSTAGSPYLDLVASYRDGATEGAYEKAVAALVALPDGHSQNKVFKELERIALRAGGAAKPVGVSGSGRAALANAWARLLPAAAVMHLEAGYLLCQTDDMDRAMAHLSIARELVDWPSWVAVMRARPDIAARHATLRRDIYVAIIWVLQTYRVLDPLLQHLERARDEFPDDAMVRLALGSFEEVKATAAELSKVTVTGPSTALRPNTWRRQSQRMRWDKAAEYYRAALTIDPALAEARVRLGWVLRSRGKLKEARQELEAAAAVPASAAAPDPPAFGPPMVVPYLNAMFLAEVIEQEGGAADALTRYQDIAGRWPDCQSGLLALSRAYEARGDRAAALKTLQTLFREHSKRACVDPWWTYYLGQGWRLGPFVLELRERVKGGS